MISMLKSRLVNERKLAGGILHLPLVLSLLDVRCVPDGQFDAGFVNSIYFDTPGLRHYSEKANGDNLKKKIRLRWYGRPEELDDVATAFLEVKYRIGSARDKVRCECRVPRKLLLEAPFAGNELPEFLLSRGTDVGEALPTELAPVVCISYDRRRYYDVESGSRVAVDWNIQATRFNETFFGLHEPIELQTVVCEFKNENGPIPNWVGALAERGLRYGSFSKYGTCIEKLVDGVR